MRGLIDYRGHPHHLQGHLQLSHVAQALDLMSLTLGAGESRKKHARQNGEDGDHHQQFDQGKPGGSRSELDTKFHNLIVLFSSRMNRQNER